MGMDDTPKKGIQVKLYPTNEQKVYINSLLDACRFVYNESLTYSKAFYKDTGKSANLKILGFYFHNNMRNEHLFLLDHNTKVLKQSIIDLLAAYKHFFVDGYGFPKYKSFRDKQSARFPLEAIRKNTFSGNWRVNLTKDLSGLKFRCSKRDRDYLYENVDKIKSFTITLGKDGVYRGGFLVEFIPIKLANLNLLVGIDFGLMNFATLSNGDVINNPKFFKECENEIRILQKSLSKKEKGSSNRESKRLELSKKYSKISRRRSDFIHSFTYQIVSSFDVIVVESLNISGMCKNRHLSKSFYDTAISTTMQQLNYKCKWYGKNLIKVDRFFASSKICSSCEYKKNGLKLSDRIYICSSCGLNIDRDLNAALNIENEGLRIYRETLPQCGRIALASGRSTKTIES